MENISVQPEPKIFEDEAVDFTEQELASLTLDQKAVYEDVVLENFTHVALPGHLAKEPVTFKDVTVDFSQEEWGQLDALQRALIGKRGWRTTRTSLPSVEPSNPAAFPPGAEPPPHKPEVISHLERVEHRKHWMGRDAQESRFACSQCGKVFLQSSALALHLCWHESDKAFPWSTDLQEHERRRSGEKPFSCPCTTERPYKCGACEKAFSCSLLLSMHRRVHTGERLYACGECGKAFNQRTHLTRHLRIHTIHTGEKPYKCGCGQAFTCHSSLTVREKIHRWDKPFKCAACGKAFHSLHQRTHTGEKLFQCSD
ncbi:zinc finger protein 74 [Microtus oregoni]|uniref:zinc finger protein 74 n=1 Tax=Microtus oregoni TaxID=111838 RepID=UPI001BB28E97|nr:zinc finger protein 74 [Microtus oregoni]